VFKVEKTRKRQLVTFLKVKDSEENNFSECLAPN